RRQPFVDKVSGIGGDDLGAVYFHAFPLPSTQTEKLLIKFIGKSLGPSRKLLSQEAIKNILKRLTVSNYLKAPRFVYERNDTDVSKTPHQNFSFGGDIFLTPTKRTSFTRLQPHITDFRQVFGVYSISYAAGLRL